MAVVRMLFSDGVILRPLDMGDASSGRTASSPAARPELASPISRGRRMTPSLNSILTTAIAALSAFGALGMLLAYLYGLRRSELDAARQEALALAATRAEVIRELEARLKALEHAYR